LHFKCLEPPEKYFQYYLQFLSDFGRTLLVPTPEIQSLTNNVTLPPRVRVRGKYKVCEYINDKGLIQMITPVMSNWYILYISRPAVESLPAISKEIPPQISTTTQPVPPICC